MAFLDYFKDIRRPELKKFFGHTLMGKQDVADGTIPGNRLVEIDSSGDTVVGTSGSKTIIGVNADSISRAANAGLDVGTVGIYDVTSATPVKIGQNVKCADNGRVTELVDSGVSGRVIDTSAGATINFQNQPANDTVDVVSDNAADTTQTVTIIGITGETVTVEQVSLNGTTAVSTTKTDWDEVLAVKLDSVAAGTVTVSENSGSATIITLATTVLSAGVVEVPTADQGAFNVAPTVEAGGASTKMVGIQYTQTDGSTVAYQADQLSGTTAQTFGTAALLVTEFYVGDLATGTTATLKVGAEEDELNKVGKAMEASTAAGTNIKVKLDV